MKLGNSIFSTLKFKEKHSAWIEHTPFAFFLIEKLKPKVFVELGTHYGGSYFAFCQAILDLNVKAKAYAVDSWIGDEHAGFYGQEVFNYVSQVNQSNFSHFSNLLKSTFDDASHLFEIGSIDLLHIDGLHTYEAVKHDFEGWLPKMSEQGVVIFHDTVVKDQGFVVWKLMDELRNQYPYFQFEHGYGLGVLCVGKQIDPAFIDFINEKGNDSFTQNLFHSLGKKAWLEHQTLKQDEHIEQLNQEIEKNKQIIDLKEDVIINLQKSHENQKTEIGQFQIKLEENEQLSERYETEIFALNEKIKHIDEKNNILMSSNDDLQHQNENIQKERQKLRKQIDLLNSENTKIKNSIFWKMTSSLRKLQRVIRHSYFFLQKEKRLIEESGLFDEAYYLRKNPDVLKAGVSPLRHYLVSGGFEGRNPSENFDSQLYLEQNPDVQVSGINLLVHYLKFGKEEGRFSIPSGSVESNINLKDNAKPKSELFKTGKKIIDKVIGFSELKLLRDSEYFDTSYYLLLYPDVKAAGVDPFEHYFYQGWKEGRNPSRLFDTYYYLDTYPDVRESKMNPLLHYLIYGKQENRLAKPFKIDEEVCQSKADINKIDRNPQISNGIKLAVVCHLYYMDLASELFSYFKNIPFTYDLFLTTTSNHEEDLLQKVKTEIPEIKCKIISVPNIGRDIAPFIKVLKSELMVYDLVCKVHSKKSNHDKNLLEWRNYLLDNLLGNTSIIETIIGAFDKDPKLGMVWPLAHPYLSHLKLDTCWDNQSGTGNNKKLAFKAFPELELDKTSDALDFPNGSMFWFRPASLKFILEKDIDTHSFETEEQQVDGTLAHVFERLFGILNQKAGFVHKTTFFNQSSIHKGLIRNTIFPEGGISILFIAHDLCRAGAEMVLLHILNWLNLHTYHHLNVLALKKGFDGGKLLSNYSRVSKVFLWEDLLDTRSEIEAMEYLKSQTGKIDLIYGNTIISANIYPLLSVFQAPYITHIHELEESIQRYTTAEVREKMKEYTKLYIPCSQPVEENLIKNHNVDIERLICVNEFIHLDVTLLKNKNSLRKSLNIATDKTIIWGCGTIYWRKGPDLFIETAIKLKNRGIDKFLFCWIGENQWNTESEEWGGWEKWEKLIHENELANKVLLLGEKENPKEYFKSGDIFYLPSREDPFPLVCLEAAECSLPVVCFEGAGGMPAFVEKDAGIVVPYLNLDAAAEALEKLIKNENLRIDFGERARTKLLQHYSDDIAVPEILKICREAMQTDPLVSIIVPVYNHEKFLIQRIESILNQTFRDFEVIILDDCSDDRSLEIAQSFLWHPAVSVVKNDTNSGSPFRQWQKGVELAKGRIIWIAEGDDRADFLFLETLLPAFNQENIKMAYCASHRIDENNEIFSEFYLKNGHYENLGFQKDRWLTDYIANGHDEVRNALAIRNTIPNVSAVLFRRTAFQNIDFEQCEQFKVAGDWYIYVTILKNSNLFYSKKHLNYHRVHSDSVVARSKKKAEETIPDYFEMHKMIAIEFDIDKNILHFMVNSVNNGLRTLWPELNDNEFQKLYNTKILLNV